MLNVYARSSRRVRVGKGVTQILTVKNTHTYCCTSNMERRRVCDHKRVQYITREMEFKSDIS